MNQNKFCCDEHVLQIVSIKITTIKGNIRSVAQNVFSTRDSEVLTVMQIHIIVVVSVMISCSLTQVGRFPDVAEGNCQEVLITGRRRNKIRPNGL